MRKRFDGFTLVELMVVITIIILMAGTAIAAYFRFSQRQAALNDGRNFSTMMRKVQALAKNLVYPSGCTELSGYTLEADGDVNCESCQIVSAYANCLEGKIYVTTDEKVLSKAFFTNDISINFKAGTGSIDPYGTFVLSNNVDTSNQIVVVTDENGVINVEEQVINP
jgi:prepilin-type N-terminal cleavage/methylation domain-containing protein